MAQETIIVVAPEVETIARQLIEEYHPELTEALILYYFTSTSAKCSPEKCTPKVRYGYSTHVKGLVKAEVAAGPDFILWINAEEWGLLGPGQQRPFIDHRLEHCSREETTDGSPRWVLKPDAIQENPAVLQRFGAWNVGIRQVRDILQPELNFVDEGTGDAGGDTRVTRHIPGRVPVSATVADLRQATEAIR